jgi:hypothetical protein
MSSPSSAAPPSNPVPATDVVKIVQSRSIGFVSLSMSSEQLRALPVQWEVEAPGTPQDAPSLFRSGPWYVVVERGAVTSVELELRSGVQAAVGDKLIQPGASLEDVAALFTECKPIEHTEDGDQIECDKRRTTVKQGRSGAPIAIQLLSESVVQAIYGAGG